jgi:hypothetical protein
MSKKAIKKTEPKKASTRTKRSRAQKDTAPEIARVESAAPPSLDQIRDRAYQIFRTGANPTDPVADWFQAERELNGDARA